MSEVCTICLEPVSLDIGMVDCGHCFCTSCIQQWVLQSSGCPLCRAEVTTIRVFYRSFYTGDVIAVAKKSQPVPISAESSQNESDASDFITEDIIYSDESSADEIDTANGTTWLSDHRVSVRLQSKPRTDPMEQVWAELHNGHQTRQNDILHLGQVADRLVKSGRMTQDESHAFMDTVIGNSLNYNMRQNMELHLLSHVPRDRRVTRLRTTDLAEESMEIE
jgi:polyhydroxyalkanoate synthesis regulator phasin